MVMTKIINENIIKAIAEYAAEDIQRQYPNVDYLTSTVRMAVIDATNKVLDTEVQP